MLDGQAAHARPGEDLLGDQRPGEEARDAEQDIPELRSLLTIVGGKPVYAVGPFEGLEERG